MNVSQTGSVAAAAYASQTGTAKEAAVIESNRQTRQQERKLNEQTGPQPLATSGSVGTNVHVTA